jgi:2-polyprenyl-6-methoxyphenol hydroxylase-like FAD-dependent oxidoreductase
MTAYVGADGLHSKVRELAFGTQEKFENHIGFCIAAFILDGYEHRDELAYISHAKPDRKIACISIRDEQTLFFLRSPKTSCSNN